MQNLGALSDDLRGIVDQVHKGKGTLGKLLNDRSLYNHLNSTAARLDDVTTSIQRARAASASWWRPMSCTRRWIRPSPRRMTFSARFTIRRARSANWFTIQRLRQHQGLGDKGNALLGDVHDGKGTLGKLATDDALTPISATLPRMFATPPRK